MAGADTCSDKDMIQSRGRKHNAAQPLNAADDNTGVERYPPVDRDDSVTRPDRTQSSPSETRAFQNGRRDVDPSVNQGRLGPGGDPAEGKR